MTGLPIYSEPDAHRGLGLVRVLADMTVDEIISKMADGYRLEYAPVSGGQCLSRGPSDPVINLSFIEFDAARKDQRVYMARTQGQGHPIFHGRVDAYALHS